MKMGHILKMVCSKIEDLYRQYGTSYGTYPGQPGAYCL